MRHRIPCRSRLQSHADALRNPPLFRCAICAQCRAESAPVPGSKAVQSEAMESTQIQALYEPPLAAMPQLSEKPRHGFETWKTEAKPRSSSCNFTVTLGLRATVVENGVRETYSARYYNPNTGRFMSRDPEAGNRFDPATLHKYLYANGDPVNGIDPTGRDAVISMSLRAALVAYRVELFLDTTWQMTVYWSGYGGAYSVTTTRGAVPMICAAIILANAALGVNGGPTWLPWFC